MRDSMPGHRQLVAAGRKLADRIVKKQNQVVDDARSVLPLARGGKPPQKVLVAPKRVAEPLPQTRLPPIAGDSPGNIAREFQRSATLREERQQMTPMDIVREMVNEPSITLTAEDLPIINDPSIMMDRNGDLFSQFAAANTIRSKPKRKVSKYQKEMGRQLEKLKKKHPRTNITKLMTKAHAATRKALGMPPKRRRSK